MKRKTNSSSRRSKTYTDNKGYSRFKDSKTPVHRSVAELKLGRKLEPGEVVHHKNRDKQDNSFGNLHVFKNQSEHWEAHQKDTRKYGIEYSMKGKSTTK